MPTTANDVTAWVRRRLAGRTDLDDLIDQEACYAYLNICSKVPFETLQTASSERAVTTGTSSYDISDLTMFGILSIRMTFSSTLVRRLGRTHYRVLDARVTPSNGKPSSYARFAETIIFDRPPDVSTYTYLIRYWKRPVITAFATTTFLTPVEWDDLIRWETLYRVLLFIGKENEAMTLMGYPSAQPFRVPGKRQQETGIIPRLWNDLMRTYQDREAVDEWLTVLPHVRPYTAAGAA